MLQLKERLKQALKEDLWNIINKEKIKGINFWQAVMEELLGCKNINLREVRRIRILLEMEYDYVLSYFYDAMEKYIAGEIIDIIKNTVNLLCKRINYLILEIEEIKKRDGRRRRAKTIIRSGRED